MVVLGVAEWWGEGPGPKFGRREAPYSGRGYAAGWLAVGGGGGNLGGVGRWNRTESSCANYVRVAYLVLLGIHN